MDLIHFFFMLPPKSHLLSSLLSRTPGASRNPRDLPDRVSDASAVGQPRLWGQPIWALREVRQGPHRPVTQARASRAPQRAIAPARDNQHHAKTPPSALATHRGMVLFCIAKDDVEETSVESRERLRLNEEAANRACAVSNRNTEKRVSLKTCVALTVDFSFCSSLWTSSLIAKIFKWHQRGDKLSGKEDGIDGRPAPLLDTNSNMCTVCLEGHQSELQSLALLQ